MDTGTCFAAAGLAQLVRSTEKEDRAAASAGPRANSEKTMNKRGLQIAMAILGIVPIATGIIGMFGLSDPIFANSGLPANAILDSNLRWTSVPVLVSAPAPARRKSVLRQRPAMMYPGEDCDD
ncbi:MAG TPA: hypothetical protein VKB76_03340 [Ktedonobacterales bacterium]|nr:hypothetical protein [Ktedonobacterales bacterium]